MISSVIHRHSIAFSAPPKPGCPSPRYSRESSQLFRPLAVARDRVCRDVRLIVRTFYDQSGAPGRGDSSCGSVSRPSFSPLLRSLSIPMNHWRYHNMGGRKDCPGKENEPVSASVMVMWRDRFVAILRTAETQPYQKRRPLWTWRMPGTRGNESQGTQGVIPYLLPLTQLEAAQRNSRHCREFRIYPSHLGVSQEEVQKKPQLGTTQ
jgi:hypothetical protein